MSVLVTGKFPADTEKFRQFVEAGSDVIQTISDDAKSKGCIHHRFGIGDGFVLVIDEWQSVDAFNDFFQNNADIPTVMRESGAQGEPEFTFAEAVDADQF